MTNTTLLIISGGWKSYPISHNSSHTQPYAVTHFLSALSLPIMSMKENASVFLRTIPSWSITLLPWDPAPKLSLAFQLLPPPWTHRIPLSLSLLLQRFLSFPLPLGKSNRLNLSLGKITSTELSLKPSKRKSESAITIWNILKSGQKYCNVLALKFRCWCQLVAVVTVNIIHWDIDWLQTKYLRTYAETKAQLTTYFRLPLWLSW